MATVSITGYTDKISVKPGETINFHVTVDNATEAHVDLVRLIHGDEHPDGPGFVEEVIDSALSGVHPVKKQFVDLGNAVRVPDQNNLLNGTGSITLAAFVFPTTPDKGRQVILGRFSLDKNEGYALGIDDKGRLSFWTGNGKDTDEVVSQIPLAHHTWYLVAASFDLKTKKVTLHHEAFINAYNSRLGIVAPYDHSSTVSQKLRVVPTAAESEFMWAAASNSAKVRGFYKDLLFNGKIDRSFVWDRALDIKEIKQLIDLEVSPSGLIANWDTTVGYGEDGIGDVVVDVSGNELHGYGIQRPIRAMTGFNWTGRHDDWRVATSEYGGIAFHDDAVVDCEWESSFSLVIPEGIKSGAYAARVRVGNVEDHVPFFVRPTKPTARALYIFPTNSYLAYANEMIVHHVPQGQAIMSHPAVLTDKEADYFQDPKYGRSTYDHHSDDEGVCYSSWHRPILNLRPNWRSSAIGTVWQFPRDLSLIAWLESQHFEYDIATDHDIHKEGFDLISQYSVVMTGSHPEYWSEKGLDTLDKYVSTGGRLMYMGGNGFYWVVSYRDDQPEIMEVRKGEAGMRAWQAQPGEYYHATSPERGGLWRLRGRAPQKLTGVGFTTQGFDECHPYTRMPDSYHKSVEWIFDGVEGTVLGDFGLCLGGAAGLETERYDLLLGTPPHTKLLASSTNWSDNYPGVHEDILYNHPGLLGSENPAVRADMTYFTSSNNGAVFATGSIAFMSSLPSFGFQNNISQLASNVFKAFTKPGALPGSKWTEDEKSWR
jgi:N,N-dimethylformamidase